MPKCYDDSCDIYHCGECGGHYAGSKSGLCYDCEIARDEYYDRIMKDQVKHDLEKEEGLTPTVDPW